MDNYSTARKRYKPVTEGARVALAPHLDLWMAGLRYGTVTSMHVGTARPFYFVQLDNGKNVTLEPDDLLGAL